MDCTNNLYGLIDSSINTFINKITDINYRKYFFIGSFYEKTLIPNSDIDIVLVVDSKSNIKEISNINYQSLWDSSIEEFFSGIYIDYLNNKFVIDVIIAKQLKSDPNFYFFNSNRGKIILFDHAKFQNRTNINISKHLLFLKLLDYEFQLNIDKIFLKAFLSKIDKKKISNLNYYNLLLELLEIKYGKDYILDYTYNLDHVNGRIKLKKTALKKNSYHNLHTLFKTNKMNDVIEYLLDKYHLYVNHF